MTQYQFTVNSISLTGALGWNTNGTLQTQNITDGFNSNDTQNCSYQYDDITRVTSANCGSAASQTFSFDPFGNINKSGSPNSFQPTYSTSTNRMTSIAGFTPTYDSNGNVTNDSFHNYTWDADGHAIAVDAGLSDAVSVSYDALGRMVEQNRSSVYTQIAYSPTGQKLALMSGQTLQKAMVPVSRSAMAVYNSSGLLYYAHPDRLGSIHLATTPARATYFDTAYAPFGETYASSGGTSLDPAYTGQMNDTAHRQDTAGGLYDFPAREYSTQGRWPSPDPMGKAATCAKDPQTQNRYAYVRNNPLSYTDPTGAYIVYAPPCDATGTHSVAFPATLTTHRASMGRLFPGQAAGAEVAAASPRAGAAKRYRRSLGPCFHKACSARLEASLVVQPIVIVIWCHILSCRTIRDWGVTTFVFAQTVLYGDISRRIWIGRTASRNRAPGTQKLRITRACPTLTSETSCLLIPQFVSRRNALHRRFDDPPSRKV
jgi:RHS repeat-associated protein